MHGAYLFPNPFSGHRANLMTPQRSLPFRSAQCRLLIPAEERVLPRLNLSHFLVSATIDDLSDYVSLTAITVPYREICMLIWLAAHRLKATHDLSSLLLTDLFFSHTLSPSPATSWCIPPTNHPDLSDLSHE